MKVAKKNVQSQNLTARVSCLQVDINKKAAAFLGKFDMIVSNPPYIATGELASLEPSVRDFEPRLALDGGADGLDCYRAILDNYTDALQPGGILCFEHGMGQEDAVSALLKEHGYTVIEHKRDNQYIMRAIAAQKQ